MSQTNQELKEDLAALFKDAALIGVGGHDDEGELAFFAALLGDLPGTPAEDTPTPAT